MVLGRISMQVYRVGLLTGILGFLYILHGCERGILLYFCVSLGSDTFHLLQP